MQVAGHSFQTASTFNLTLQATTIYLPQSDSSALEFVVNFALDPHEARNLIYLFSGSRFLCHCYIGWPSLRPAEPMLRRPAPKQCLPQAASKSTSRLRQAMANIQSTHPTSLSVPGELRPWTCQPWSARATHWLPGNIRKGYGHMVYKTHLRLDPQRRNLQTRFSTLIRYEPKDVNMER